jgi:predicted dehydrogenase
MARKHCTILKTDPRASLKTLVVSEGSKDTDSFKNEFGFQSSYKSLEEAFNNETIDIVYIVSPNLLHEKQVNLSLSYGKHVFCEKPLAYTSKEFASIEENLSKSRNVLQVGMNCRYREQFSIPKQMISGGDIGELRYIKCTYIFNLVNSINEKPWWLDFPEEVFPFLHTGAVHALDLLRWYGGTVKRVSSFGSGFELKDQWNKDNFVSIIEFEKNIIGEFTGSASANRPPDFSIEVWGSKGSIVGTDYYISSGSKPSSRKLEIKQEKIDLLMQFDDLVSSIENQHQPMNSFGEAKRNRELISAIENSVKSNKIIILK